MNCPKCNRENEEYATYCRCCGSPMQPVKNEESNISNIFLIIWCIGFSIVWIIQAIVFYLNIGYDTKIYIYNGCCITQCLLNLFPVFAIKNKILKIICIIIMSILCIWDIIRVIQNLI